DDADPAALAEPRGGDVFLADHRVNRGSSRSGSTASSIAPIRPWTGNQQVVVLSPFFTYRIGVPPATFATHSVPSYGPLLTSTPGVTMNIAIASTFILTVTLTSTSYWPVARTTGWPVGLVMSGSYFVHDPTSGGSIGCGAVIRAPARPARRDRRRSPTSG